MTVDLTQLIAQLPIAGAMVWFAYYIVSEARKEREKNLQNSKEERELWAVERREMYEKMSESHLKLSDSIEKTHGYIKQNTETLKQLHNKRCYAKPEA
jgi:hypothetical protein